MEQLSPAIYIATDAALQRLVLDLAGERLLAVDTESNSLHAYQERVCLVQMSSRYEDYIIDPLAIEDMSPLGALLENPDIEKVFHAAEYDLFCLKRDFGFNLKNLFDTMIAARVCGFKNFGLDKLLNRYFGITPDKSHQRDDWARRPLPADSLQYAQMDTHYLPGLRDELKKALAEAGREDEAQELFEEALYFELPDLSFDPEGYWRIGRPQRLSRREMAVLREVYLVRDALAQENDVPPFKIVSNKALVDLAQQMPRSFRELDNLNILSGGQVRLYGDAFLSAVAAGRQNHVPTPPPLPSPPDPVTTERYTVLQQWRKVRAEERGVGSDVVISKEALWALAREMPTSLETLGEVTGLGPWRLKTYGNELLDVIATLD